MADSLTSGQNTLLPDLNVTLDVTGMVDLTLLVCGSSGQVSSDDDMYFYNRPSGPGVQVSPGSVQVALDALRPADHRLVLIASPADQVSTFGALPPVTLTVLSGAAAWQFVPTRLSVETALVLCQIYRHHGAWKVRALGQGYASGLAGVATDYGITVDDSPVRSTSPAPPPTLPAGAAEDPPLTAPSPPILERPSTPPPAPAAPPPALDAATTARGIELATALADMIRNAFTVYETVLEQADSQQRALAMSRADYVDGIQQHPISKQAFADMAQAKEAELVPLLHELRGHCEQGRALRQDLFFLIGGPASDNMAVVTWMMEHLSEDMQGSILGHGIVLAGDFGTSVESFLRENQRLTEAASR